jgi:hypothetical protein
MATDRRTKCTWTLPAGIRSAISAEADRRDVTPSAVVEQFFLTYLPEFIQMSVAETIGHRTRRRTGGRLADGPAPRPDGSKPFTEDSS